MAGLVIVGGTAGYELLTEMSFVDARREAQRRRQYCA